MVLEQMLMLARQKRAARIRSRKERERQKAKDAGHAFRESHGEVMEKVASALFGRDFLNDLDRLLIARKAKLCLLRKGKRGELYALTKAPDGSDVIEVLMRGRRDDDRVHGCFEGEVGSGIYKLMQLHEISMCIGWVSGNLLLQAGNQSVSTTYCLTMIQVTRDGQGQYMNETEIGNAS